MAPSYQFCFCNGSLFGHIPSLLLWRQPTGYSHPWSSNASLTDLGTSIPNLMQRSRYLASQPFTDLIMRSRLLRTNGTHQLNPGSFLMPCATAYSATRRGYVSRDPSSSALRYYRRTTEHKGASQQYFCLIQSLPLCLKSWVLVIRDLSYSCGQ